MRIVFMGSPEFALTSLQRLIDSEHELVAVYTQPDRPVGRGRKFASPPVKTVALAHGLDVRQPESISTPAVVEELRALAPDIGVIAAYGQILPQSVLDLPRLGLLNVHASLLPRWRGAAPIPAAILAGDAESGATIMRVVRALDAGPMLASARVAIENDDTTATLMPRIAEAGAELLLDVLPRYASGELTAVEQDDASATYAPQLSKIDALIDWQTDGAETVGRKVRAYDPWPVAYTLIDSEPVRILACCPLEARSTSPRGTIVRADDGFAIATIDRDVAVVTVQPPGGKPMPAAAYLRGHAHIVGKQLG